MRWEEELHKNLNAVDATTTSDTKIIFLQWTLKLIVFSKRNQIFINGQGELSLTKCQNYVIVVKHY